MLEKFKKYIPAVLFGCKWGVFELTLGGFLHSIHYPLKGQIMSSIGYAILAVYVIKFKNLWHPLIIGVMASLMKTLDTLLYGFPLLSQAVINPAVSIIIEAMAFTAAVFTVTQGMKVYKRVKDTNIFKLY